MLTDVLGIGNWAAWAPGEVAWDDLPPDDSMAMHWRWSSAFEGFLRQRGFRIVVTARHPIDVLLSILQYAQSDPTTNRWLEGEAGDERALTAGVTPLSVPFVDYALSWRAAALLDVSVAWSRRCDALIRYAEMVRDPIPEIALLLRTLNLTPKADIAAVLEKHSPANTNRRTPGHFWQGTPDLWRRLVIPELAYAIRDRHPSAFTAFGFSCEPDPDLTTKRALENWRALTAARGVSA